MKKTSRRSKSRRGDPARRDFSRFAELIPVLPGDVELRPPWLPSPLIASDPKAPPSKARHSVCHTQRVSQEEPPGHG